MKKYNLFIFLLSFNLMGMLRKSPTQSHLPMGELSPSAQRENDEAEHDFGLVIPGGCSFSGEQRREYEGWREYHCPYGHVIKKEYFEELRARGYNPDNPHRCPICECRKKEAREVRGITESCGAAKVEDSIKSTSSGASCEEQRGVPLNREFMRRHFIDDKELGQPVNHCWRECVEFLGWILCADTYRRR